MDPKLDLGRSDIDPERIQSTQSSHEDTESYGHRRARGLEKIKIFNFVLLAVSLAGIACGLASVFISAPEYDFPMAFPGGAAAGGCCLLVALFGICGVRRAHVQPHGDMKDCCFKCLFCLWMLLLNCALILSLLGFGMSGVWSIIECRKIKPADSPPHRDAFFPCLNSKRDKHLAAAYANLAVCGVLFAVTFVGNCFWCCYGRALGFKDRREIYGYKVTVTDDSRVRELETELDALRSQQASDSQRQNSGDRYLGDRKDNRGDRYTGGPRDNRGDRYSGAHRDGRGGRYGEGHRGNRGGRYGGGDIDHRGGRYGEDHRDERGDRYGGGYRDDRGGRYAGGPRNDGGGRYAGGPRNDRGDRHHGDRGRGARPSAPPAPGGDPDRGRYRDDPSHHGDRQPQNDPEGNSVHDDAPPPSYKEVTHAES